MTVKMDNATWAKAWAEEIKNIPTSSYDESANALRRIIQKGLLRFTDIRDHPERFFLAHRLIAAHAPEMGPGFFIRFTVQYNLFAGTVVGLGGPEQLAELDDIQQKGLLGCFGLTERFAGVNSGMIAQTTAVWDAAKGDFVLQSPQDGATKNWISQGCVADKCVAVADLLVNGKSYGPHAFLMDFRRDGKLLPGITIGDMGRKTVGNDLDNAWIRFEGVRLPKDRLLNKYADVIDGQYVQKVQGIKTMEMIGQRLFSGRVGVAQAALSFGKGLYERTKKYTDNKMCWSPNGEVTLTSIPHIKAQYERAEREFAVVDKFVANCEAALCNCLRESKVPPVDLMDAIAVAKVKCVETSIQLCFALKQEVGSYALMDGVGFEQSDFLQCCKFAEGDSRILMQKMARDRMRSFGKKGVAAPSEAEARIGKELQDAMTQGGKTAWDDNFEKVFDLAEAIMQRMIKQWTPSASL